MLDNPAVAGLVVNLRDLSDEHLAELAASESSLLYRSIVETADEGIWIHDVNGNTTFANPKMAELLSTTVAELAGCSLFDFVDPEDQPQAAAKMADRRRGVSEQYEFAFRRRDGSKIDVLVSASPLRDVQGLVTGALKMITDIGGRKRAEAQAARLEAEREEAHRLESLGQLAGGVAHDFNNLLGVIANYATLIARQIDDPVVAADVNEIQDATTRAAALTRQLLLFARRDVVNPELIDVNDLVREISRLLERTLGEPIELVLSLDESRGPLTVLTDRHQLEQVLLNLALNARDAMARGGRLTITTDLVDDQGVGSSAPGAWVRIRVSDTGHGMPADVVAHAFEPFFTTKPRGEGTGLGLATAHGVVAQHGGEITIDSEPGRGTTLEIVLPARAGLPTATQRAPEVLPGGSETVLLVEDEDALRTATARILTAHGYRVIAASDGDEALALLHGDDGIDLVLTDIVMRRMSGIELAAELARTNPDLPVLFTSGHASPIVGPLPGLVLDKPVPQETLLRTIRHVLDRRR